MPLSVGDKLGPYEILAPIGKGGMGEVYKARDTRLGRLVAIKVLPDEISDPERKRRFMQEAKAASALNHPNIVTVYDIGNQAGVDFIVMEFIVGQPLTRIIPSDGMRLPDALACAIPVAEGLARAHAAGIVHRDLKPGNILVGENLVKIVDFGLAKLVERIPTGEFVETQATNSDAPRTEDGAVLGTLAYMSPEQVEGKAVDARSDVFSFGSVLYEMLSGRKAFHGASQMATITSILRDEPTSLAIHVPGLPRELERLVNRCLRKDPNRRWQSIADARTLLQEYQEDSESGRLVGTPQIQTGRSKRAMLPVAFAFVVIVAAGIVWWEHANAPPTSLTVQAAPLTSYPGTEQQPSFSPDGTQVAFSWDGEQQNNFDIYVKRIGPGPPLRLTQNPNAETDPSWSPDGSAIAFLRAARPGRDRVVLIPPLGGPERLISEVASTPGVSSSRAPAWTPDGKWLAIFDRPEHEPAGLWLVSVETRERHRLTTTPANAEDVSPSFAPDGSSLAFTRGSVDIHDLYVQRLENLRPQGDVQRLTNENQAVWNASWSHDSRELVYAAGPPGLYTLWRKTATPNSRPRPLNGPTDVRTLSIPLHANGLVYVQGTRELDIYRVALGPQGDEVHDPVPLIASSRLDRYGVYSPDGTKIAFTSLRSGGWQIWVCESNGANPIALTSFTRGEVALPVWSPDSQEIRFESNASGSVRNYTIDSTGGKPRELNEADGKDVARQRTETDTRDGSVRYVARQGALWRVTLRDNKETEVFTFNGEIRSPQATKRGIYFVTNFTTTKPGDLMFYRFPNGPITKVKGADNPSPYGLSVSPDEQWLLYTKFTASGSDLMLVENFQ